MNKASLAILISTTLLSTATASAGDIVATPDLAHNLWWEAPEQPIVTIIYTDTLGNANTSSVTLTVTTDRQPVNTIATFETTLAIQLGDNQAVDYPLTLTEPGFYRCSVTDNTDGRELTSFNIGYEPTLTVSLPDAQPDFDAFWAEALEQLAAIPGNYTMTEDPAKSGSLRKAYAVTMQSWGGETIKAYVYIPMTPGPHPAHIHFNGYGAKPWDMDPDGRPEWIELVTSVRGQFYSEPDNTYGDWIRYKLDDPANYYYHGAYMDAIRAIDFVSQLDSVDTANIYAEGGSQGGALTLAAAALDPQQRLRAIFPYIPFMSDFPDYFRIVDWPHSAVDSARQALGMTQEQMYLNLSYFDIKNMARRIKCPMLMGIGLQDSTCPPHTNMASYVLISAPKQLVIYPTLGHTVDYSDWIPRRDAMIHSIMQGL